MTEFMCQWWPLLTLILLGLITSILCYITSKKNVATSLGRLPGDPEEIADRLEYKGCRYVQLWPSGACITESSYNDIRRTDK